MRGKIIFINPDSRLVAAYIGRQQYIVFEHANDGVFHEGDIIEQLSAGFGPCTCVHENTGQRISINVLSSAMSQAKAKLVVAPWQDEDGVDELSIA